MKKIIVIGAGPAGIACGDFLCSDGMRPVILEKESFVGGLSRTMQYRGFRFDVGSHRFFTKNRQVSQWWQNLLKDDFRRVMRQSRIYYKGVFFDYPISMHNVIRNLGITGALPILLSYIKSRAFPRADESNFERWVVNRFGGRLYRIFFKEYTEKVWGISCDSLSSDWASQRIKGLSLLSAVRNALLQPRGNTVKTLINEFRYPRLGAGMMYEKAAQRIAEGGGSVLLNREIVGINYGGNRLKSVLCRDSVNNRIEHIEGDHFCSSMPLTELVRCMGAGVPDGVSRACLKLKFRSLILVFLIVRRKHLFRDNWIYVNSSDVSIGRVANFKNWSADMVPDKSKTSLGVEFFCTQDDSFWRTQDAFIVSKAVAELDKLKLAARADIEDGVVLRVPNAYPVYEKGYAKALNTVKDYVCGFKNLHCMGRYGMFRYNNMDHSILTGLLTARNISGADEDIWDVNADRSYHEEMESD